ncbi:uncharacterized protein EI97DRAFT_434625 [Westerdykella ornata]|uniref:SURP motif domain-containing protein n=1 Tax=Westerdykella ornata TaxID=318751 RepID=A0A6A6JES2_WESOR|nr:uncharacterized protein EI97DRAFT_434625 [Westerdykella ornata]KAF2275061.1 hypothetical protein EI97DRAFT_434625 [Westerdykella ornata]
MAATNGVDGAASNGDALQPPADMVIPPLGVREKIAKTADFIFRKGPAMEQTLRDRSGHTSTFSYLNQSDPYYAYFAWYLQQLREGKAQEGGRAALGTRKKEAAGPPEPPKFRFSARMPNISAKDLEVLKLTALYTAKNGENWLKELRNKESGNFQFDFLRPTHSFFQFFRAIVDQYKILLEEQSTVEARIEELRHNVRDRFHVLDRAKQRAAYTKYISQQKEKEEKKKEEEQREYASIDWHDFAVIATVEFDQADDAADLPPPTTLNDLQSASLEQKALFSLDRRLEEAAPDEEVYYNVSEQRGAAGHTPAPAPVAPPVQPTYQPSPMPAPVPAPASSRPVEQVADQEQAERDRARAQAAARPVPGSVRIREDYVPRARAARAAASTTICPNCHQQIPLNEFDEHMRIAHLLDPRWKEQREKSEARYATTSNFVDVAGNLKRLASQRDDVFDGVTGIPISEEEEARRKRAAMSYDGQPDPAKDAIRLQQMQNMNVQEQLRRIHEKHGAK